MPIAGVTASAIVSRVASKAAVWPKDVFAADPLMPTHATNSSQQAPYLTYCGFYPDPQFVDAWFGSTTTMTYAGSTFFWSGSEWRPFTPSNTRTTLTPTGGASSSYVWYLDWNRLSLARRITNLDKLCVASPLTAWAAGQYAVVSHASNTLGHVVRWNGTAWEFASTGPEYLGNAWDKTLTPGCAVVMDPNITAGDATNAAKLTGLGYTMNPAIGAPGFTNTTGAVRFPSPTANTTYSFFWTGAGGWTYASTTNYAYMTQTLAHAGIAALPAEQRAWAAEAYATVGASGNYEVWSPTSYTTIGGQQMYGMTTGTFMNGVSPGTAPPTPVKTALLPDDQYVIHQSDLPALGIGYQDGTFATWLTAAGYRAAASEKLAWRSNTAPYKRMKYLGASQFWNGSHWSANIQYGTPTALAPTTLSLYNPNSSNPNCGAIAAADQVAVMNSYFVGSPSSPWTADQHVWMGNAIIQWNGTSWVILAAPVTIHEAATYAVTPGQTFIDSRVTASNSTIAAALLGYGYVPLFRSAWVNRTTTVCNSDFRFYNMLNGAVIHQYYWNGTAWVSGAAPSNGGTLVNPSDVVTNAAISALPANEQVTACSLFGYYSSTSAHWTSGQSATIAGNVVHWHWTAARGYWAPGAAP